MHKIARSLTGDDFFRITCYEHDIVFVTSIGFLIAILHRLKLEHEAFLLKVSHLLLEFFEFTIDFFMKLLVKVLDG